MKKFLSLFAALILVVLSIPQGIVFADDEYKPPIVYTSSANTNGYPNDNAFDGKLNTITSIETGSSVGGAKVYLAVDLGMPFVINSVVARSRRDIDQENGRKLWEIQVANKDDFSDAIVIGEKPDAGERNSDLEVSFGAKTTYRYVRLISNMTYMVVSEFEIDYDYPVAEGLDTFDDLEGTELGEYAKLLKILGIVDGINENEFGGHLLVGRGYAADIVARLMNMPDNENPRSVYADVPSEHEYAAAVEYLNGLGILADAEHFYPEEDVRLIDFLKMVSYALGYSEYIRVIGPYENSILKVTRDCGLLSDVEYENYYEPVNKAQAARIAYNALMAHPMIVNSVALDDKQENIDVNYRESDKTYLEQMFNLFFGEAVFNGNAATTLISESSRDEGVVIVGGREFNDDQNILNGYFGKNVMYFYNDSKEIVCAWEQDNNEVYIRSNQLVSADVSGKKEIKYYNNNNKLISASLKAGVDVIRNGVCDLEWVNADFQAENAEITLIDNDDDRVYDVIMLDVPQILVLDYGRASGGVITFTAIDGSFVSLPDVARTNVHKNGNYSKVSRLAKNDLVYIYASKSGKTVRIESYSTTVTGRVQSISADSVVVDGISYKLSEYYKNHKAEMTVLKAGTDIKFAVNNYDELVWIFDDSVFEQKDILAYICDADEADGAFMPDRLKIFTENKEFLYPEFADRVLIDGTLCKTANAVKSLGESYFKDKVAVVKMRDGKITALDTEYYNAAREPESNMVDCGYDDGGTYRYNSTAGGMFKDNDIMALPLLSSTKMFVIPQDMGGSIAPNSGYDKYFDVVNASGILKTSQRSAYLKKLKFFSADDFGYPEFGVAYKTFKGGHTTTIRSTSAPAMLLNEVEHTLLESGDVAIRVTGINLSNGEKVSYIVRDYITDIYDSGKLQQAKDTTLLESTYLLYESSDLSAYEIPITSLKTGDIIRYSLSGDEIYEIERVFDVADKESLGYSALTGYYYATAANTSPWQPDAQFKLIYARVDKITADRLSVKLDSTGSSRVFSIKEKIFIHKEGDEYKKYTAVSDINIKPGQKVMILTTGASLKSIIAY
ncbi:MAG: discoidin domain-containing protein [Clostridia bacterium]|nr:discoidin domain-containing protein [Clostridia bacterium]